VLAILYLESNCPVLSVIPIVVLRTLSCLFASDTTLSNTSLGVVFAFHRVLVESAKTNVEELSTRRANSQIIVFFM